MWETARLFQRTGVAPGTAPLAQASDASGAPTPTPRVSASGVARRALDACVSYAVHHTSSQHATEEERAARRVAIALGLCLTSRSALRRRATRRPRSPEIHSLFRRRVAQEHDGKAD